MIRLTTSAGNLKLAHYRLNFRGADLPREHVHLE